MKVKTSITISRELLKEIDRIISKSGNRSLFIEEAVREYLKGKKRQLRDRNDTEIINRSAGDLNREAEEVLSYQVKI
ncbi:MAG: ribbon-helix-helix protein, CopG family [Spirochaetes bacterium]|nr:ribbon-helix-helix protein, CopG family [Spirochaetota bacterium]